MTKKAAEKIIDALTQLMEGFTELQESVEEELGAPVEDEDDGDDEPESNAELEGALLNEVRASLEAVIEGEDYSPEDVATMISLLTDALQEIDPNVFEQEEGDEDEEEEEVDDDDDDDIDDIDDDDDYDFDEDEDEEDEDEEESEDDE